MHWATHYELKVRIWTCYAGLGTYINIRRKSCWHFDVKTCSAYRLSSQGINELWQYLLYIYIYIYFGQL